MTTDNKPLIQTMQEALLAALPYVTDVIDNPEQLACFKRGTVRAHERQIRAAIEQAEEVLNPGHAAAERLRRVDTDKSVGAER